MYTSNPYVGKARRLAVNDVIYGRLTQAQAARRYGVHRATIGKWIKRASPDHRQFIDTIRSRPSHYPREVFEKVVGRVVSLRRQLKRSAPVIHAHLINEGYTISVRTVGRILKRKGLVRKKKYATWYTPLPRPLSDAPGSLVQVDTIQFVKPDKSRFYIYCLIDVYSRLAYAEFHEKLSQKASLAVILNAQRIFGFTFRMVQTDNGPEFKDWLQTALRREHINLRHSRVRKPNDNAHIERFNRTIQEECFKRRLPHEDTVISDLIHYLEYYNHHRLHFGLHLKTPIDFVAKVLS